MSSDTPPTNIWLIRQDKGDYTWCDFPDPDNGVDADDVFAYTRTDDKIVASEESLDIPIFLRRQSN